MSSNRIADVELAHTPLPAPREESGNVIGGVQASGGVEVAGGFELELDDMQLVGRQGSDTQVPPSHTHVCTPCSPAVPLTSCQLEALCLDGPCSPPSEAP